MNRIRYLLGWNVITIVSNTTDVPRHFSLGGGEWRFDQISCEIKILDLDGFLLSNRKRVDTLKPTLKRQYLSERHIIKILQFIAILGQK